MIIVLYPGYKLEMMLITIKISAALAWGALPNDDGFPEIAFLLLPDAEQTHVENERPRM